MPVVPARPTLPWAGWLTITALSGVLPSGSMSLPSTLMLTGRSAVVEAVSSPAIGPWLTAAGLTVTRMVAAADSAPPESRT
ncbi:hypothetical protein D3C84_926330 [compost metagenome]